MTYSFSPSKLNRYMDFDLSNELIDQIIFAMEDQQQKFVISGSSGELFRSDEVPDNTRTCFDLPDWQPIDGFNLMEKFVSHLRNPIFRDQLKDALSSGKGVFRQFKDILKKNREIEQRWFLFKAREMKQVIRRWYNEQRELAGLTRLGPEPEETGDLLLSDFTIDLGEKRHLEEVLRLDRKAFLENHPKASKDRLEQVYGQMRKVQPGPLSEGSLVLVAETPAGEFSGFAWGIEFENTVEESWLLKIVMIAVVKHYRGLGLGSMLLNEILKRAHERIYDGVEIELSGLSLGIATFLESHGFAVSRLALTLDLNDWGR